ncbi:MAG TPA: FAD-dependent oxidoreductase, partial [Flavobacteriales bacterium]|nr:FAD-dependent oxidoreductase [Flavobacteriales bacterium]
MSEQANWDVVIVGGGIVGAATLYKLQARFPQLRILLLEKEKALADHQTGHNSGVIHSGIYYKPGSYKARNCVTGRRELVAFAKERGIKHDVCGKLIVATDKEELPRLEKIYNTGIANGIEGMERITAEQIREVEPFCEGVAGVRVGCTGIIDFRGATEKMAEIATSRQPESKVSLGEEFLGAEQSHDRTTVRTSKGIYSARYVIFCGGLQ